jgi:DUF1009 family protein
MIAGSGHMPKLIARACAPRPLYVIAYHGYTDPNFVKDYPHVWLHLGQVGQAISWLREQKIQEIVMVGKCARPSLRHLLPDSHGLRLLSKIGLRWPGDNHLLTLVQEFLHEEGFVITSPQEMMQTLIAPLGSLGAHTPSQEGMSDIEVGRHALSVMSCLDFGQGLAVQNGLILGVEAAEGTNECIMRCGQLAHRDGPHPIYIKRAKVGQNEKLDLPVIGPETLDCLVKAGFQGIAYEAERTLLLSLKELEKKADQEHLFLWGGL